ncbi:hypothetical protein [Streptomyces sp. NPDC058254]|uniref:hypothetical protein n=1 Tax=Streptomyces sp. NPDC058254 TaxID=3346406 RepID=UPI0036EE5818
MCKTVPTPATRARLAAESTTRRVQMTAEAFPPKVRTARPRARLSQADEALRRVRAGARRGPVVTHLRAAHAAAGGPLREALGIILDEIARTQDLAGVGAQLIALIAEARAERAGAGR